jgi:hypothetical protein
MAARAAGNTAGRPLRVPAIQSQRRVLATPHYLVITDTGDEMRCDIRYGQGRIDGFAEAFGKILSELCHDPAATFERT